MVDVLRYAHRPQYRALILRKTLKELTELIDKSRELYPKTFPGAKFKEQEKVWHMPSGAKITYGYLEKDADVYQYQGQAFAYIAFDEITHLPTEFSWNYLASRLRTTDPEIECYMRATTNPGGPGHSWVKKRYIDPAPANTPFCYGINKQTGAKLYRKFIPASLSDNPYLYRDGDYEAMLETLPEVERRRLLHGDWNVNEGVAFPEFSRATHVIPKFDIPSHWYRFKSGDYGYSAPSVIHWMAVDPEDGTIILYRELHQKGLTGEGLGDLIMTMEMEEATSIPGVMDTAVWNRTGFTGPTIGQALNAKGCKFRPADKNRIAGKIQVHERLKPHPDSGRPKLQIFETCTNIIRELESLPLSPNNSEDVDTKAEDHCYDALRYGLMSRPKMPTMQDRMTEFRQQRIITDQIFGY
ncbi:terminase family protein [bacterium]|nr:terminase family protein [bacterium]